MSEPQGLATHQIQSRQILATTLQSIGDAVIATDQNGHITFMNPVAEKLVGWKESEAKGLPCSEVFRITNQETGRTVESPVDRVLREGFIVGLANHTLLTARDGTQFPIDDSGAPIRDAQGNLFGVVLVFRDVTEQRRAALIRERLAAIVASSDDAIISKDLNGIITSWNPAAERLYGYSAEEAIGQSKAIVIPHNQQEELTTILQRIRSSERIQPYETKRIHKNGRLLDVSISVSPLKDAEGKIIGASTIARDITEKKQMEIAQQFLIDASAALASSLDYERTLQQVANLAVPRIADWCGVDILQEDGSISQLAIAHVDPEKVKWGHELRKRYPPDPDAVRGLPHVLRTGQAEIYTDITDEMLIAGARDAEHLEIIRQIGLASLMIVPMTARGRTLGAISFVATHESRRHYTESDLVLAEGLAIRAALAIDNARLYCAAQEELAERRHVEEALRMSEERFRFALATSDISVYMADRDLRYTWIYSGRAGGELSRLYGKTDADFLIAEDAALLKKIKQRVLETGIEERHIVRATYLGAAPRFFDTVFAPLRDATGEIVGITGTVNDITERKKAQDALAQHQTQVELLNMQLQRSMRETHHRVKNNLQIVMSLVNMQQMQYADYVPASELVRLTQHIKALASIHDLLTHQAQAGMEVSTISITEIIERLMPTVQGAVAGRNITVAVQDLYLPVRQSTAVAVLINELVSNALKHGKGEIRISFDVEDNTAILQVQDEGPGFPENFTPGSAANTGLDLIASLSQMDLRGGVRYENRQEGGARVVIRFPVP